MGQKKLIRFAAIKEFPNVVENDVSLKGRWNNFFKNENRIVLELACGKGEYTVGLASRYPDRNFIGVDIKGNRLWKGAKTALDTRLLNAAFLRTQIDQIDAFFKADEVSEIWITFPDPQLRFSKIKKRLTHPKFLRKYQSFLQPDAPIHLKTDSPDLYFFTLKVIQFYNLELIASSDDLYNSNLYENELKIKTHYETLDIAQSSKIFYLKFRLNSNLHENRDEIFKVQLGDEAYS